jgi:alpha-1,2-mannosyltransferase
MVWTPITLMTPHEETAAPLWRQLAGGSYLWWALAVIVVVGAVAGRLRSTSRRDQPAADSGNLLAGFPASPS